MIEEVMGQAHVKPPAKRLLTRVEAAAYCGLGSSPPPVKPKHIRPGKQGLRYDVRDLDEWIDRLHSGEYDPGGKNWLDELDDEET
jgi:hypothetical protein